MRYARRPGLSPAAAVLIARGDLKPDRRILDIGCGTGTDCLLLAQWGFRQVTGIDPDAGAIRTARARATRLGRRVRFLVGGPEDLPADLTPHKVDVVLHTLVGNNLERGFHAHFREVARALKPGGLLIATTRSYWDEENLRPGKVAPVPGMRRYFDLGPGVSLHIAESRRYYPGHAPVAVWVGRPRPIATTRPPTAAALPSRRRRP